MMNNKDNLTIVYIGEELDDIFGDDEINECTPSQLTPEMREKLKNNLIEEGFLVYVTLH